MDYFLNGTDLETKNKVLKLLEEDKVCICPPIYQEILQGVKHQMDLNRLKDLLNGLIKLLFDPFQVSLKAAELYFNVRKEGITVRKSYDCLIAAYALNADVYLFHRDKDFKAIS
ncbi:type II toxin-antitoxin system VapC family toxin [Marivirga sp.]|uniref:type II toxin-antitoxin system VapC family toxin n=1 Tax=Marivirga sp. TaxID=2018662 RepID=UPI002D7F80CF|nr:PIN domain-containing protein [Marivirga sp.]HET8861457.1 PIN domain-containing protein [Marivirga sp.]